VIESAGRIGWKCRMYGRDIQNVSVRKFEGTTPPGISRK
jgi:hypothetical protein